MTNTTPSRYALSFTNGGLLVREAVALASVYLAEGNWQRARGRAAASNLLQTNTASSSERILREVVPRVSCLDQAELALLIEASPTEQRHLMWSATCRRYGLIAELAEEVLRERFLLMTPTLSHEDLDRFLIGKSLWHPELDELRHSTRQKLRQNVFRMLREAGLLTRAGEIVPAVLSTRVAEMLGSREPSDIRFFPTPNYMKASK